MRNATFQTSTKLELPTVRADASATTGDVDPPSDPRLGGPSTVNLLNFRWLTALRWAAVVGQTIAIFCVTAGLRVPLPMLPVTTILLGELIANLIAWHRGRTQARLYEGELAAWVGFDWWRSLRCCISPAARPTRSAFSTSCTSRWPH